VSQGYIRCRDTGPSSTTDADIPELTAWEAEPDTATRLGTTGPAWHARAIMDREQLRLIALHDATPIGFVVLAGLAADCVELRRMVIAKDRRRAGYGRARASDPPGQPP
jgi:hypothetical protein